MDERRIFGPENGHLKPKDVVKDEGSVFPEQPVADAVRVEGGERSGTSERNLERKATDAAFRESIGNIATCIPSEREDGPTSGSKSDLERLMHFCTREGGTEQGRKKTNMLKALMVTILMSGPGSALLNRTADAESVKPSKKIEQIHHKSLKKPGNLAVKESDGSWERMERESDKAWDAAEKRTDKDWDAMEKRMEKSQKSSTVINEADW
jgi:hypothetical protein